MKNPRRIVWQKAARPAARSQSRLPLFLHATGGWGNDRCGMEEGFIPTKGVSLRTPLGTKGSGQVHFAGVPAGWSGVDTDFLSRSYYRAGVSAERVSGNTPLLVSRWSSERSEYFVGPSHAATISSRFGSAVIAANEAVRAPHGAARLRDKPARGQQAQNRWARVRRLGARTSSSHRWCRWRRCRKNRLVV